MTGRVRAHIFVDIDRPDTDLMVRMTDLYPDGRSMPLAALLLLLLLILSPTRSPISARKR